MNDNLKECILNTLKSFFNVTRTDPGAPKELKEAPECKTWKDVMERRDVLAFSLWAIESPNFVLRGGDQCTLTRAFAGAVKDAGRQMRAAMAVLDYY